MYARDDLPHYLCNNKGGCGNRVRRTSLESAIEAVLTRRMTDAAWASRYVAEAQALLHEKEARLRQLEAEQAVGEGTIRRAFELLMQGQMPQTRYQIICEPHETRLQAAKPELATVRTEIETLGSPDLTPETILEETRGVSRAWGTWNVGQRRAFLESRDLELSVTQQNDVHLQLQ